MPTDPNIACCAHRRVINGTVQNGDGTVSDRWTCDLCNAPFEPSLPPRDVAEETLWHLSMCLAAETKRDGADLDVVSGPPNSSWPDLLCAIMEGFERGWVEHAHLTREDGTTHLRWAATNRGDRAIAAHRERIARAPVIDETGEDDDAD